MAQMALGGPSSAAAMPAKESVRPRHASIVRVTHWLTAVCFLALLLSGVEVLISHPRFYWGEAGNAHTRPLFIIPVPASRATVPTGYGYVLPDQNGWSRSLHFQSAWLLLFTGAVYLVYGFVRGHFRRNLIPAASDLSVKAASAVIANHLRLRRPGEDEAWSYNVVQRLSYLAVVFGLFPLIFWTGLAMSPAVASAAPALVSVLGGQQSARTIHFFVSAALAMFLGVHVVMVVLAGFGTRVGAMFVGRTRRGAALPRKNLGGV
jgi:thiosulfate reductase cytochrome b subunit